MIITANLDEGANIENFFEPDRDEEPLAAIRVIDPEDNFYFNIYERQVDEANRIIRPIYEFVADVARSVDKLNEHHRIVNCEDCELLNFHNELSYQIEDGAFLIVGREPIPFERYRIPAEGSLSKPVYIESGSKQQHEVVLFQTFTIRANTKGLDVQPEIEISDGYPVNDGTLNRNIVEKLKFNPNDHRIALMEIDTPQIRRL